MSTHHLAMHCGRLELFCFHCGDYVYDVEFDLIRRFTLRAFREGLEVEAADHVVSCVCSRPISQHTCMY